MRLIAMMLLLVVMIASPYSARAEDKTACPSGLVCATNPKSVADALAAEGYRAKVDADNQGDPAISSASSGYNFDVLFYGCVDHKRCDSLQFRATFEKNASSDVVQMNKWNRDRRFSQMAVRDDGTIILSYDVSTIGGLTKANFADVISWWSTILGEASKFFDSNSKDAPAPAKP
ncbi:YbjN domain-containing protein [Sphingomonas sp.]|uniref:YbjN domain-containing protein n=1 Tax=Sphingomonas sp. TaxID=28214 RepID=UPI0025D52E93|nr:YbjN domain-containing protein [Sphingomonas sp.]